MPAVHQSRAGRASKIEQALPVQTLAGRFVNRPVGFASALRKEVDSQVASNLGWKKD
jgi:hypothetical protein